MWRVRHKEIEKDSFRLEPDSGATAESGKGPGKGAKRRKLKRRAGCIWGVFTEPLVIMGVTFLAVIFGRAYLVRRARRLREQQGERDRKDNTDE